MRLQYTCPKCKFQTRNLEEHNKTWHPTDEELDDDT